jgi:hypothetical protein
VDPQAEQVSGVIVEQPDDPGLEVLTLRDLDEELAFDVDVPELVWGSALVSRADTAARDRRPRGSGASLA